MTIRIDRQYVDRTEGWPAIHPVPDGRKIVAVKWF